jgi:hypothetical protein
MYVKHEAKTYIAFFLKPERKRRENSHWAAIGIALFYFYLIRYSQLILLLRFYKWQISQLLDTATHIIGP